MSRFTALAETLPSTVPFVGPETQERAAGQPFRARLGANESVFGPSPMAVAAMQAAAIECWQYGDPEAHDLKAALASHLGVMPENLVVGEGIDGLLGYIVRLFVAQGDAVVTSLGAYPTFNYHVAGFGGRLVTVPYVNDHEDPASLLAAVQDVRPKLVYFANPDNPMGTCWSAAHVQALIDGIPDETTLVLDEAYLEFAAPDTAPALDTTRANVIRMRTFSKAYGMAGLRVGYAIAERTVARGFDKIRNHFGLGRLAQAGALAALSDHDHLARVVAQVKAGREELGRIAADHGLKPIPSQTNFVALDCGRDGDYARAVMEGLLAHGIFVRMPGVAPLNRCIRVTVGSDADLAAFEDALPGALRDADGQSALVASTA